MNNIVFKVSQVNDYIKKIFEAEELVHNIRIVGEVGSLSFSGKSSVISNFSGFTNKQQIKSNAIANKKCGNIILQNSPVGILKKE